MTAMRKGQVATEGGCIYFEVHGEGPPLVLAHGVGGNHAIWYRQLPVLARANRVVTFDHRGFGLSSDHDGRGRSAFVDDLGALLDHLDINRVALLGQSMGAGTCIGLAARSPERVAALILADSLHGLVEPAVVRERMDRARAETADLCQIARVLGPAAAAADPDLACLYAQLSSFNAVDRHSLSGAFTAIAPAELAALSIPTLFIAGMEDRLFPIEAVRAMQAEVPGSYLVEIADAGHSAFLEQPVAFNDSVLSFLMMAGHVGKAPAHSNSQGYTPA